MPTITDTLTQLGQDLRDAIASARGLYAELAAIRDNATSQVRTIINNYEARPPVTTVWVDPTYGDDSRDGSTAAKSRRSIDTVISDMKSTATAIYLLGDVTLRNRLNIYAPLSMLGVDANENPVARTFNSLGTADNSPIGSKVCAGLYVLGPSIRTTNVDFTLPDVPAGHAGRSLIVSVSNLACTVINSVVRAGAGSGALFGTQTGRLTASVNAFTLVGAQGHVFDGVASGENPNTKYPYTTNLAAA